MLEKRVCILRSSEVFCFLTRNTRMKNIFVVAFLILAALISGTIAFSDPPEKPPDKNISSYTPPVQEPPITETPTDATFSQDTPIVSAKTPQEKAPQPLPKPSGISAENIATSTNELPPDTLPLYEKTDTISVVIFVDAVRHHVIVPKDTTALQAMKDLQDQGGIQFSGKDFGGALGFFVEEINEIKNDRKKGIYWVYSINGEKARIGISNYILQDKDIITWTYENEE